MNFEVCKEDLTLSTSPKLLPDRQSGTRIMKPENLWMAKNKERKESWRGEESSFLTMLKKST